MLALFSGLGTRSLSALLRCTFSSKGAGGGLETLTRTREEKDVSCTSHRTSTLNSKGEEADKCVCNVESQTYVCT